MRSIGRPTPLPPDGTQVIVRDLADDAAVVEALAERFDRAPTVVTLTDPSAETSRLLLRAGARGVIGRDASADDVDAVVAAVSRGFVVLAATTPAVDTDTPALTTRERAVLDLLARGWSNRRIGEVLSLAENTVKFHVASILNKLDATTRTQAVTIGVRRGYIML